MYLPDECICFVLEKCFPKGENRNSKFMSNHLLQTIEKAILFKSLPIMLTVEPSAIPKACVFSMTHPLQVSWYSSCPAVSFPGSVSAHCRDAALASPLGYSFLPYPAGPGEVFSNSELHQAYSLFLVKPRTLFAQSLLKLSFIPNSIGFAILILVVLLLLFF